MFDHFLMDSHLHSFCLPAIRSPATAALQVPHPYNCPRPLAGNGKGSLHRLEFKVPSQIAPVMLGFQVKVDGESEPTYIGPRHGSHFTVPVGVGKGTASKLGESLVTA